MDAAAMTRTRSRSSERSGNSFGIVSRFPRPPSAFATEARTAQLLVGWVVTSARMDRSRSKHPGCCPPSRATILHDFLRDIDAH